VLAEPLHEMQPRIGRVSPWIRLLDLAGGRTHESIFNFSLERARDGRAGGVDAHATSNGEGT